MEKNIISQNGYHSCLINLSNLPPCVLRSIDQNSPYVIGLWDKHANLLFVTQTVQSILGYEPTELLGNRWKDIVLAKDLHYIYKQINKDELADHFNITIIDCKENLHMFESKFEKVIDETNDTHCFIGYFNKSPTVHQTAEMIVHSEKMSVAGQLAAGIAHEIRNPLTSLKGFLQLLQTDIKQKDIYYRIMEEEIDKIDMITSELLFISKPLTNEKKIETVHSMVQDVMILLGSQARLENIQLESFIDEELYIYCDRSQIKQVLINLVKNAIDAMEKSGKIEVRARLTPHKIVELDIIDQGPGISKQLLEKIEEPFFTTKQTGTGLGLTITKEILQKHHGQLKIVKSDENGSIFRISFPEP